MFASTTLFTLLSVLAVTSAIPVDVDASIAIALTPPSSNPVVFDVAPDAPVTEFIWDDYSRGRRIHPVGRTDLCLALFNEGPSIVACTEGAWKDYQYFDLPVPGYEPRKYISVHQFPDMCLEAGVHGYAKKETCDGAALQEWVFAEDSTIRTANGTRCLTIDKRSDTVVGPDFSIYRDLQTRDCSTKAGGDPYQAFVHVIPPWETK